MSKTDFGVGRCHQCGARLLPTDFLDCVECYKTLKATKRRYRREVADRQLQTLLTRIEEVSADPFKFHWVPEAVILFGSMLKKDGSSVGDIDLCVLGIPTHHGLESFEDYLKWAKEHAPNRVIHSHMLDWGRRSAISYIRKNLSLVALASVGSFDRVGGGRSFPYEVIWTRAGSLSPDELRAQIEAKRPLTLAAGLRERERG